MTREERISLLKAVAEAAPEKMKAEKWHESAIDGSCASVSFFTGEDWFELKYDKADSRAIFSMLNAMVEAGWGWSIKTDWYDYHKDGYRCEIWNVEKNIKTFTSAPTMGEAVAEMFIRAFTSDIIEEEDE